MTANEETKMAQMVDKYETEIREIKAQAVNMFRVLKEICSGNEDAQRCCQNSQEDDCTHENCPRLKGKTDEC